MAHPRRSRRGGECVTRPDGPQREAVGARVAAHLLEERGVRFGRADGVARQEQRAGMDPVCGHRPAVRRPAPEQVLPQLERTQRVRAVQAHQRGRARAVQRARDEARAQRREQQRSDRSGPGDAEHTESERQPAERLRERGDVGEPEARQCRPGDAAVQWTARVPGGDRDGQHRGADRPRSDDRAAAKQDAEAIALVAHPEGSPGMPEAARQAPAAEGTPATAPRAPRSC